MKFTAAHNLVTAWKRGGLPAHFVALALGLTVATSAAVALVLSRVVDYQVEQAADRQLIDAEQRFREHVELERQALSFAGTALANHPALQSALDQGRMDTVRGMLTLVVRAPVDESLVADASGNVLSWVGAQPESRAPSNVGPSSAFQQALAGQPSSRVALAADGSLWQELYVPVQAPGAPGPARVMRLSDSLDQSDLDSFRSATGVDVSLFVGSQRVSSTFRNSDGSRLDVAPDPTLVQQLAGGAPEAYGWRELPSGRIRTRYTPLLEVDGAGRAVLAVAIPYQSLLGHYGQALLPAVPIILIIMALGASLTYILSRRISQPILLLARAAARMQGGDLNTPLPDVGESVFQPLRDELENARAKLEAAQRAMRESDERHRDLVENIPHVVCLHDFEGRVLFINPAGAQLTGYERPELLTMNLRDLVAPEFRDEVASYLAAMRQTGSGDGLMRVITKSGDRRILHYSCSVREESAAGGPVVRGIGYDMTERFHWIELQKALFAGVREPILATAPDDHIVLFNTAASDFFGDSDLFDRDIRDIVPFLRDNCEWLEDGLLWQGRLVRRGEPLDVQVTAGLLDDPTTPIRAVYVIHDVSRQAELSRQREQLLHSVAHELNNPISIIENTLSLVSGDVSDMSMREVAGLLQTAYRNASRLHGLTEDLLSAGSIQAGRFQVTPRPTLLTSLIEDAIDSVQPVIDDCSQRIETSLPDGDVSVLADEQYASHVLGNLLTNASKYSPPGSVISLAGQLQEGCARVSVTDQGPGVPTAEQKGIFERFYRGRPGRDQPGVGLGLAIAKGMVEAHGGEIGLDSTPGQGATFWFTLPLAIPEALAASERSDEREAQV